jgi:uncharacterized protein YndB with AHSA1/START domain
VWDEWTEPERFADWFGGPQSEVPLSTVSMDVRPGGRGVRRRPDRDALRAARIHEPEQYDRAKEGWASFFDRIAERLASA